MADRATFRSGGAVSELLDVLGDWQGGARPLFRNLARAIAGAIERGVLAGDVRLPSERALAAALAIGRGTAVAAYEVLVADGLVERRRGSGTYVAVIDQPPLPRGREGSGPRAPPGRAKRRPGRPHRPLLVRPA